MFLKQFVNACLLILIKINFKVVKSSRYNHLEWRIHDGVISLINSKAML